MPALRSKFKNKIGVPYLTYEYSSQPKSTVRRFVRSIPSQHLQQLNLPSGFSGEIVFKFTLNKGRVGRVVLDEKASTLKNAVVVEKIKRSLLVWILPSTTGKLILILRIHT